MRRILFAMVILCIAALSLGQTRTGWQIDYQGHIDYVRDGIAGTENYVWDKPSFDQPDDDGSMSGPPQFGPFGPTYHTTINGTVSVRLKWFGPGEPSNYPNFTIRSLAVGTASDGSGSTATANNGYKSVSSSTEARAESYKLIQPGKKTSYETQLSISVAAGNKMQVQAGYQIEAAIDGRYARVRASSIPEGYSVKGGEMPDYYTLADDLWDGPVLPVKRKDFMRTLPTPADPVTAIGRVGWSSA